MRTNLAITGVGLLTPVGLSAPVCLHSVRSAISRLIVQPYPDRTKEWLVGGSILNRIPHAFEDRLCALAELALREAWQQACGRDDPRTLGPTALLLGAPEPLRPGYRFPPPKFDPRQWLAGLGIASIGSCEVVEAGHCSAQAALSRASRLLGANEARTCLIGVADTQLQIRVTRWHENHYRLKCAYMTDGLMPGEASCFLVVEDEASARARGASILARVLAVATDREPATVLSDQPNTAQGLTRAVRTALRDAAVSPEQIDTVWSDLNGESYRAREWAFTEVRLKFQTHTELMHPADCHGDLGAASDANLLALAALAQATGWAHGRPLLVFSGSEGGVRAATVIAPAAEDSTLAGLVPVTENLPRTIPAGFDLAELGPDEVDFSQTEDPRGVYFEWQLRQEHLEELASLYYQRRNLFLDPRVPWSRAREPEQRILNHLDAAVAGGAASAWAVASGLKGDEEGVCFAGALLLAVLPSDHNFGLLDALLQDPSSTNLAGVGAGLMHAPSQPVLRRHLDAWLNHRDPGVRAMAASVAGYRREGDPQRLLPLLRAEEPGLVRAAVDALRRFRHAPALGALEGLLTHADPDVRYAALLALMCLGARAAPDYCRAIIRTGVAPEPRAAFLLALCGHLPDLDLIFPHRPVGLPDVGTVEAMGLLGNVHAVPYLFRALGSGAAALKVAAGEAFEMLTGAGLRETAVVVEVLEGFEEDGGDEREVERVCTSAEQWSRWWRQNEVRFVPRQRWRRGRPFDLGQCIAELRDGKSRHHDRQRAYLELVMHSGQNIPFEADWFVTRQEQAIEGWEAWWRDQQSER